MHRAARLFIWLFILSISQTAFSQANRIPYNNQNLFLSGANLAWVNFAADIGPGNTDFQQFGDIMLQMHDNGGNALRWWLHTNGALSPQFNDTGLVIGPGNGTISDIKKVLDIAWKREIGINLCLWSFDMLRSTNGAAVLARNKLLLNDTNYTRSYINNCLIPMVDSLRGHPAIISWEIFNEPEGMSNEFGWSDIQHVPMSTIQRFVNLCTGAIHREDSTAKVTNGSWSFLALTDVSTLSFGKQSPYFSSLSNSDKEQLAGQVRERYRSSMPTDQIMYDLQHQASASNYNYYLDSRLIAAGGDSVGTLDFYSVHYYNGTVPANPTSVSPFHHPKGYWNLNKPLVIAEFALQATSGIPKEKLYDTLYQNGYAGALAWSWTDIAFSSHADMLSSMKWMYDNHTADVDVNGISGAWPTVTLISPKADTTYADSADIVLTAQAADADGTVDSVEFFVNDTLKIGVLDTIPYSVTWKKVPTGRYSLSAVATDNNGNQRTSNKISIVVGKQTMVRFEAEAAPRSGPGMSTKNDNSASNHLFVDIATNDSSAKITWQVLNVTVPGTYQIAFGYKLNYASPKTQYINVNGASAGTLEFTAASTATWYEKTMNVNLIEGKNTIQMQMFWGWMYVDYLAVPAASFVTGIFRDPEIPEMYSLQQNYPNPFNPVTTIRFTLQNSGVTSLKVYDMIGREVTTLVNEKLDAGVHETKFSASKLSSGIYFYQLHSGNFVATKKLVLLK